MNVRVLSSASYIRRISDKGNFYRITRCSKCTNCKTSI